MPFTFWDRCFLVTTQPHSSSHTRLQKLCHYDKSPDVCLCGGQFDPKVGARVHPKKRFPKSFLFRAVICLLTLLSHAPSAQPHHQHKCLLMFFFFAIKFHQHVSIFEFQNDLSTICDPHCSSQNAACLISAAADVEPHRAVASTLGNTPFIAFRFFFIYEGKACICRLPCFNIISSSFTLCSRRPQSRPQKGVTMPNKLSGKAPSLPSGNADTLTAQSSRKSFLLGSKYGLVALSGMSAISFGWQNCSLKIQ